jgi:FixJ family two-component response regulator
MSSAPTVFVVDDEDGFRASLARLVRSAGLTVRDFASAAEFLAEYDANTPGCLVLDFAMPGLDGVELQRLLRDELDCDLPVVFLTGRAEVPDSVAALKQGALEFLTKPAEPERILAAVHDALARNEECRREKAEVGELRRRMDGLTPREREVFEHVVTGQLNKQIARDLGTAEKTIRIHRGQVMKKMQADSVATLVRIAERLDI